MTLVFTDIEGSTSLLHEIGPAYGEVLDDHHRLLREVWARFGGVEVATEGDAFFVSFASPTAAVGAVEAAQIALAGHAWPHGRPVRVRMGVHTGEPQQRDGTYWGVDVHYAARLCAAAHGDQVVLSAATRALVPDAEVDDLGEHAVKDFPAARNIFHLVVGGRHSSQFPPLRTIAAARTNLPSIVAPLLGREAELTDLRRRLTSSPERLVTLVGAGGTGKTRIAIAAGTDLLEAFEDGVFLVSLARVQGADGVAPAIAEAIGVATSRPERGADAAVLEHLRARRTLLVIDNFEHVLEAAASLARLLEAAPGVRILVTSQAPLRLTAETVVPLEPLAVPDLDETDPAVLAGIPAVELFVERARAADPSFALDAGNAAAVAALCRRLDGLPLALELAAARVRMAGVNGLLDALARDGDALGRGSRDMPDRQRGLRAALNWTISLLEDQERDLFAGLGVFADAWTIEQAERVIGGEVDLWDAMAALIDFSLIRTRGDGRLTMADRVRIHARELLGTSDREQELRVRHAELIAETAEHLSVELLLDLGATIARARDLLEEVGQALRWSAGADPWLHRRLLGAASRPLYFVSRLPGVAEEIVRLSAGEDGADVFSGRMMVARAMVEALSGRTSEVVRWTEAAVRCHRSTADCATLLSTMSIHAHMLTRAKRGPDARACIGEALELAVGYPDHRVRDQLEGTLAFAAVAEGNYDEAEERLRNNLARPERTDYAAIGSMSYLADCALGRGDGEAALGRYASALQREMHNTDANNAVLQLIGIAASLAQLGRDSDAALMYGAVEHVSAELGRSRTAMLGGGVVAASLSALAARLEADELEHQRATGRELSLDQAAEMAFGLAAVPG